ncbi:MAG TPA: cytochrome c3 family protein [Terriglobales bacterium]
MKYLRLATTCIVIIGLSLTLHAQLGGDQLGTHDLTPSGAGLVKGALSNACLYCHAPHGSLTNSTPLWNQQLSSQTYNFYTSTTYHQTGIQPALNNPSKLCLSCHDGTVAPGQTVAFGAIPMTGSMKQTSVFGTDLKSSHPFSLQTPLVDSPNVNVLLFGNPGKTADPAVNLINGSIECTTCHQPHFQNIDKTLPLFLVRDSSSSSLCLACHDPTRVVNGQANFLAGWGMSIHAVSPNTTSNNPYVGGYSTVAQNGCNACHMPHNASGPVRLLRGANELDCASCHAGTNTQPALLNVYAEFAKVGSHPAPSANNLHDRAESALLNNNRHATCVDCHNPHASLQTAGFTLPPAPRPSQNSTLGVSETDGTTPVNPAVNQYETCLRCHGTSSGKQVNMPLYGYLPTRLVSSGDPLNVIPEFALTSTSSHPVFHDRSSVLPQPSLRSQMLQLDGVTAGRTMGTRIFCTDCHNSDDNREFGGTGPNGPHGSKWMHILERRYEISQAASPGSPITNLFPNPDLTSNGPYGLCAKCHDLSQVVANTSFQQHSNHINVGVSCSVCHSPHGMGGTNANVSGERLVNFDIGVVAPNGSSPISYNRVANTCSLTCHGKTH